MTHPTNLTPLVRTENLGHTYANGTRALRGVDTVMRAGEFLTLLGPSGAGKSTLLRCINGLLKPTQGAVYIDGQPVDHGSKSITQIRRQIGFVFQQFNLVKRLNVLQNVMVGRLSYVRGMSPLLYQFSAEEKDWAIECLDRVGMAEFLYQRAEQLSGGQQQRVAIARALAQRPRIVLADEPVASLDPMNATRIMDILRSLSEEGIAVLCNLHQVEHARNYSDRVLCLSQGSVVFCGQPTSISYGFMEELYGMKELA